MDAPGRSSLLQRPRRNGGEGAPGHRVWRLPAGIDTDALAPVTWMKYSAEVIAQHCLEALRPQFALEARAGDVIVAGPDFGIGSSREQAASALVHLGIAAVIAPKVMSGTDPSYVLSRFATTRVAKNCAHTSSAPTAKRMMPR